MVIVIVIGQPHSQGKAPGNEVCNIGDIGT